MTDAPMVSVLIPARNEEEDIERCLRAVLAQDHPHDRMEIVLVDGGSTDETSQRARRTLQEGDVSWTLISNPAGTTPSNLNVGLEQAEGDIVCRVDARSTIPPHYLGTCAEVLETRSEVVVVGGTQSARPRVRTPREAGIARALNNRLAMGGARYRSSAVSGPADTVYLGAFRTAELRRAGGWDERFATNQDFELNRRLGRSGIVWFEEGLTVEYRPRRTLPELWQQYHRFGRWKVRYWRSTDDPPRPRQLVAIAAPATVVLAACGAVAVSKERLRTSGVVFGCGAIGLVLVDHVGVSGPASPPVRLVAMAATATVAGAWLSGIARELFVVAKGDAVAEEGTSGA